MRIAVLGAAGGLGRSVVDAARMRGHDVVALVRNASRAQLPDDVVTIVGDARRIDDAARTMNAADAAIFCINPPFATWLTTFRPLLDCAIAAAHQTGARLVFPANVWIYGAGRVGDSIGESRIAAPTSRRGALRNEMEQEIRTAGIRYAIVRLPEFYGPGVVSLTARVFRAALANRRALWPGPLHATMELVYIPDAAQALVAVAAKSENAIFHLTGTRTTPYTFAQSVYRAAGRDLRVSAVPPWMLASAGLFSATARGAADISHLWTSPILLDSTKYTAHFGAVPRTPLADAIGTTLAWHRAHPELRLQA